MHENNNKIIMLTLQLYMISLYDITCIMEFFNKNKNIDIFLYTKDYF